MNLINRIKKLEKQSLPTGCSCSKIVRIKSVGENEYLCAKCLKDIQTGEAEIVLVLPSLDAMPVDFQNFKGKVYAGFNHDLV